METKSSDAYAEYALQDECDELQELNDFLHWDNVNLRAACRAALLREDIADSELGDYIRAALGEESELVRLRSALRTLVQRSKACTSAHGCGTEPGSAERKALAAAANAAEQVLRRRATADIKGAP